jgi:hypothetical protein
MNFFSLGSKMFSKTSSLLLIVSGVAIALAFFSDRRRLRSGAVKVTKGALIAKDEVKNVAGKMSSKASGIVKEAYQNRRNSSSNRAANSFQASLKDKGHRMAVATTASALTLKEKAQAEFKSIVAEAKERRATCCAETRNEDVRSDSK